jgi:hypothetical protein
MPREITAASQTLKLQAPGATLPNDFKDRLVKLIPSEIVTAYITIQGLISGTTSPTGKIDTLLWIVIAALIILTPIYLIYVGNVKKTGQLIFTTIAFIIWVIVIGSPIKEILDFPASFIGSIMLVLYTLVIPFVYKG